MKNQPLVSVILPTRNRQEYIGRAVESVLLQTYKNIELIIVNDASTDKTNEIISEFSIKDKRIIVLTNEINLGLVKNLNKGALRASGKYIARLDDDDFWCYERKIEKQVDFLEENTDYVLVGGGAIMVNQVGKEVVKYLLPEKDEDIRKTILVHNPFAHVTVLFRRNAWEKLGGYDESFDGMEDWDLWLRMGKLGKFYNIQDFFVKYLGHQRGNLSHVEKKYNKMECLKLNVRLRKKYRKGYPNYGQAVFLCWLEYFYSFLPFRHELWPLTFKLRAILSKKYPYR
jgi:glycosyltransferase involved in cell wall biosynthesis